MVAIGLLSHGLYKLTIRSFNISSHPSLLGYSKAQIVSDCNSTNNSCCNKSDVPLWHSRLSHISISKTIHISGMPKDINKDVCNIGPLAKQHRLPFTKYSITTNECFQLLHVDVWELYKQKSINGALTLIDDFSRSTWTYWLIKNKFITPYLISLTL